MFYNNNDSNNNNNGNDNNNNNTWVPSIVISYYLVFLDVSLLFGKKETVTLEGNETIMKTGNVVYIKGQRKTMLLVFKL